MQENQWEYILFVNLESDEGGVCVCACVRAHRVRKEQRGGEPESPRDTPGTNCSLRRKTKRVVGLCWPIKLLKPRDWGEVRGDRAKTQQ